MKISCTLLFFKQVYIVAVQRQKKQSNNGRPPLVINITEQSCREKVSSADELLELVQGDLGNLSKLWLSALQDFALLTLPSEYAFQLPAEGRKANRTITFLLHSVGKFALTKMPLSLGLFIT